MALISNRLQPFLFPIETYGVKVYTIADCYPDPFGVAITKRFELVSHIASGSSESALGAPIILIDSDFIRANHIPS